LACLTRDPPHFGAVCWVAATCDSTKLGITGRGPGTVAAPPLRQLRRWGEAAEQGVLGDQMLTGLVDEAVGSEDRLYYFVVLKAIDPRNFLGGSLNDVWCFLAEQPSSFGLDAHDGSHGEVGLGAADDGNVCLASPLITSSELPPPSFADPRSGGGGSDAEFRSVVAARGVDELGDESPFVRADHAGDLATRRYA